MRISCCTVLVVSLAAFLGSTAAGPGPEVRGYEAHIAKQIALLEDSCSATAAARAQRQEQEPLYVRLGGYDQIRKLTGEIVRLHLQNDSIKHLFEGIDTDRLADRVADFMAAGTGGSQVYDGRDMRAAHAHLSLTNSDFLAAGGDVGQAMQNLGYGQDETDEVICILVSLRSQVVGH